MSLVPWDPPCLSDDCASDVVLDAHEADAEGHPERDAYSPNGLTGATSPARFVGGTASGAPVAGTFEEGDYVVAADGGVWICTTAGSPGTWIDMSSGRQLAYQESNAVNSAIGTTPVDLTGLSITFTVSSRPVLVAVHLPFVLPSAAMTVIAVIRDEANTDKRLTAAGAGSSVYVSPIRVEEIITVPGTYTRKASVFRFGGSGTITVGAAASLYFASIGAVQQ